MSRSRKNIPDWAKNAIFLCLFNIKSFSTAKRMIDTTGVNSNRIEWSPTRSVRESVVRLSSTKTASIMCLVHRTDYVRPLSVDRSCDKHFRNLTEGFDRKKSLVDKWELLRYCIPMLVAFPSFTLENRLHDTGSADESYTCLSLDNCRWVPICHRLSVTQIPLKVPTRHSLTLPVRCKDGECRKRSVTLLDRIEPLICFVDARRTHTMLFSITTIRHLCSLSTMVTVELR